MQHSAHRGWERAFPNRSRPEQVVPGFPIVFRHPASADASRGRSPGWAGRIFRPAHPGQWKPSARASKKRHHFAAARKRHDLACGRASAPPRAPPQNTFVFCDGITPGCRQTGPGEPGSKPRPQRPNQAEFPTCRDGGAPRNLGRPNRIPVYGHSPCIGTARCGRRIAPLRIPAHCSRMERAPADRRAPACEKSFGRSPWVADANGRRPPPTATTADTPAKPGCHRSCDCTGDSTTIRPSALTPPPVAVCSRGFGCSQFRAILERAACVLCEAPERPHMAAWEPSSARAASFWRRPGFAGVPAAVAVGEMRAVGHFTHGQQKRKNRRPAQAGLRAPALAHVLQSPWRSPPPACATGHRFDLSSCQSANPLLLEA